jgi:hypothetical protein
MNKIRLKLNDVSFVSKKNPCSIGPHITFIRFSGDSFVAEQTRTVLIFIIWAIFNFEQ